MDGTREKAEAEAEELNGTDLKTVMKAGMKAGMKARGEVRDNYDKLIADHTKKNRNIQRTQ